ncbi:hypothetical protein [Streptomyces sulphureus]|uniref:hypothetical protein n=1 Tax=Streptomyces sulphureus TaxID=47758 RepID=UPI00037926C8|nr:hypothetical protein [Streptomyces sulphureus]
MGHSTDLKPAERASADSPDFVETVARVLVNVAEHFTTTRPTEPLDQNALLVSIGAESYKVCGRSIGSQAAHISRATLSVAPAVEQAITRGEYALRLRKTVGLPPEIAQASDDNERVIPRIPGPRREPQPEGGRS